MSRDEDLKAALLKLNMMIHQRLDVYRVIEDMDLVRNEDGDILRSDFEEKMKRIDDFPLPKWSATSAKKIRQVVIRKKKILEQDIGVRLTSRLIEQYVAWARFH